MAGQEAEAGAARQRRRAPREDRRLLKASDQELEWFQEFNSWPLVHLMELLSANSWRLPDSSSHACLTARTEDVSTETLPYTALVASVSKAALGACCAVQLLGQAEGAMASIDAALQAFGVPRRAFLLLGSSTAKPREAYEVLMPPSTVGLLPPAQQAQHAQHSEQAAPGSAQQQQPCDRPRPTRQARLCQLALRQVVVGMAELPEGTAHTGEACGGSRVPPGHAGADEQHAGDLLSIAAPPSCALLWGWELEGQAGRSKNASSSPHLQCPASSSCCWRAAAPAAAREPHRPAPLGSSWRRCSSSSSKRSTSRPSEQHPAASPSSATSGSACARAYTSSCCLVSGQQKQRQQHQEGRSSSSKVCCQFQREPQHPVPRGAAVT